MSMGMELASIGLITDEEMATMEMATVTVTMKMAITTVTMDGITMEIMEATATMAMAMAGITMEIMEATMEMEVSLVGLVEASAMAAIMAISRSVGSSVSKARSLCISWINGGIVH